MDTLLETFTVGDVTVSIYPDENPSDPRDDDNIATLVCWHSRYDLGDRKPTEQEKEALQRGGFRLLSRYLRMTQGVTYVVPLGLFDHSGLHMWVGGGSHVFDPGGWDSGTVGFAYIDPKRVKDMGATVDTTDAAIEVVTAEVGVYTQYLEGDVYGYVLSRRHCDFKRCPHDDVIDSCWGFYGMEDVRQAAREAATVEAVEVRIP